MKKNTMQKLSGVVLKCVLTCFVLVLSIAGLTACTEVQEEKLDRYLCIQEVKISNEYEKLIDDSIDENDKTEYAYFIVGFTDDKSNKNVLKNVGVFANVTQRKDTNFIYSDYNFVVDFQNLQSDILNWVDNFGSEKVKEFPQNKYKIMYQYATVYDSLKTNGKRVEINNKNLHLWINPLNQNLIVKMNFRNANSAGWYTIAILCAIPIAILLGIGTVFASQKRFKKRMQKLNIDCSDCGGNCQNK